MRGGLLFLLFIILSTIQGGRNSSGREVERRGRGEVRIVVARTRRAVEERMRPKEERQQRKLLRKKKKKLRELREEIRRLNGKEKIKVVRGPSVRRKDDRWRRRVLEKMDTILKRLDRMEKQWGGPGGMTTMSTVILPRSTPSLAAVRRMDKNMAAIARSFARNGNNGTACDNHKQCRPGRCCHRVNSTSIATPSPARGQCVFHGLDVAAHCSDSCQCANQLQCYAENGNTTQPHCKVASSTDILTGTYLLAPSSIFPPHNVTLPYPRRIVPTHPPQP